MAGEAGRVEEEEEEEEEEDGEGECCQAIMLCRRHRLLPRFLRIHRSTTRCDSASASTSNDDDGAEEPRDSQCGGQKKRICPVPQHRELAVVPDGWCLVWHESPTRLGEPCASRTARRPFHTAPPKSFETPQV